MTVSERVRELIGDQSERSFAEKAGIPFSTLKGVLEGSRQSLEKVVAISEATGASLEWLATGRGPKYKRDAILALQNASVQSEAQKELVEIPRYDAKVSAGNGHFTETAQILSRIPFTPEFFSKNLQRAPKDMIIVDAKGDSMLPTMEDRDLVMIDTSTAQEPLSAGIYAFSYDGALFVKRLQRLHNGILVSSDNKDYREFTIASSEMDQFKLIGRVVWIGRML